MMIERKRWTQMIFLCAALLLHVAVGYANSDSIDLEARPGPDDVTLIWQLTSATDAMLDSYRLEKSVDGGTYTTIYEGRQSRFADATNLQAGSNYCYQVTGLDREGRQVTQSNIECVTFGTLSLAVPQVVLEEGATDAPIPIQVINGTGLCIVALDVLVAFDSAVVAAKDAMATAYTSSYAFVDNLANEGQVKVSAITAPGQCVDLQGAGELFHIMFDAVGGQGSISSLDFITGLTATVIYDDDDLFTPMSVTLTNGSAEIAVAHQRGDLSGDGVINSADARLALMIATENLVPTQQQSAACDVNGDRSCTHADSSVLLCYAAYQDWQTCGLQRRRVSRNVQTDASVGLHVASANSVELRIAADDWAGGAATLVYDPAALQINGVALSDGLSDSFTLVVNDSEAGLLRVAMASAEATSTADSATLNLQVRALQSDATLNLIGAQLNDNTGLDFVSNLGREVQLGSAVTVPSVPTAVMLSSSSAQLGGNGLVVLVVLLLAVTVVAARQKRTTV